MAAACFPIASTPTRAFGGLTHRVTAVYGTVPVPAPGPPTQMAVPPSVVGPGRSSAVQGMWPTWSIVRPSLPRVLPSAGQIPHGVPGLGYTVATGIPAQDLVVKPVLRNRTGAGQARVTNQPKPRFRWPVQGMRRG